MSSSSLIVVDCLTKRFKRADRSPGVRGALKHLFRPSVSSVTAVDGISFSVEAGESVAYVGPNGAGKSTTVKLLTGILVPSSGTVSVCGLTPFRDRVTNAKNISVVFGQRTQLWWDIPVVESFRLLGDIYEVGAADFQRSTAELTEVLELGDLLSVPARQLSLGQRMRCDLAAALIHSPRVLYLDEPTIGLDVAVKARFREFIRYLHRERGLTVVLTSHDLGDIEELCPRMMMIDRGRIIYDGALADLNKRFGWEKRVVVTLTADVADAHLVARQALGALPVRVEHTTDASFDIWFDSRVAKAGEILRNLPASLPVADVAIEETGTEAIVRRLYEGQLSFAEPSEDPQPSGGDRG